MSLYQVLAHAELQWQLVPNTSAPGRPPAAASGAVRLSSDVRLSASFRGTSTSYRKPRFTVRLGPNFRSSSTNPAMYHEFQRGESLKTAWLPLPTSPIRKLANGLPEPQQLLLTAADWSR